MFTWIIESSHLLILCQYVWCLLACVCAGLTCETDRVKRPTSCSCVPSEERSGLLRVKLGAGEAGFRNSSSAESELDMASPGFSVSPAAENTTITLGRGSVRLSWMNLLTRVVAAGSGLKDRDWRSLLQPSEPLEPLEPFCCMRAASQPSAQIRGW